ncbi:uncharacterized protein EI90DRAFT_3045421 [Cantharellus anzutake]|uniref:uncharacterized protein n=1 Tax=Cantharellus anzutake TaxID=1750568 RepID=UPI0019080887|nr:uncharacterized protein EI90DRAFT_3045421 [Cantharellus anzutake]KAF8336345.1 hypothetical protein EI90DRAFT_3045421 [Cantharellus anzutake]
MMGKPLALNFFVPGCYLFVGVVLSMERNLFRGFLCNFYYPRCHPCGLFSSGLVSGGLSLQLPLAMWGFPYVICSRNIDLIDILVCPSVPKPSSTQGFP